MTQTIKVDPSGTAVTIMNLVVTNRDFSSVVSSQQESKREQVVFDVIAVGSAAIRRVQTTVDVEFVEKRFNLLSVKFEKALSDFEKETLDSLTKRFSPTETAHTSSISPSW